MRIYFVLLRFSAVSLATAGLDNGIFILSMHFLPQVAACLAIGRMLAGTFQFVASRRGVFHSRVPVASALPKFCVLVLLSGTLSYLLVEGLVRYGSTRIIPAKLLVESILFAFSFILQRDLVFTPASPTSSDETLQPTLSKYGSKLLSNG
jgi:putative flippase GtrA